MAIKFLNKGLGKRYQDLARKVPEIKERVLREVAQSAQSDFEKTVATWDNPPEFEIEERPRSYAVVTDDERYKFVDQGTRPHVIKPTNGNYLAFQGGYQAKTTPRVIGSRSGGPSGAVVFTQVVNHPGIEAREFTKTIYDKWQDEFPERMQEAINQGMESVGL